MRTIKELAQQALDAQQACNLSGVVHTFSSAISDLRKIAEIEGWLSTDKINQHPISVMYSSMIASLTNSDDFDTFHKAYKEVLKLSKLKEF